MSPAHHFEFSLDRALPVEHVLLESEEPAVAARPATTRSGPVFSFLSRLRGCETELSFSTDHCLTVRQGRPGRMTRAYLIDVRFVDASATAELQVAWHCWLATALLVALSAIGLWHASQWIDPRWSRIGQLASTIAATASACVGLLGLYRTRVVIELHSVHGAARLVEVVGDPGSARDARSFVAELARQVEAARRLRARPLQQFLRDEMREHHRLWSEGVLSATAYESGKRRILAAHG